MKVSGRELGSRQAPFHVAATQHVSHVPSSGLPSQSTRMGEEHGEAHLDVLYGAGLEVTHITSAHTPRGVLRCLPACKGGWEIRCAPK